MKIPISEQTPRQIDAHLASIYANRAELYTHRSRAKRFLLTLTGREGQTPREAKRKAQTENQIASLTTEIEKLNAEAAPFEEEYTRRGHWRRYFLVTNQNGHVHRGMSCSTCFPTTEYQWLTHLSGCDEREMVAQHGTRACTVCFPGAPTIPEWQQAEAKEKADAAAIVVNGKCRNKSWEDVNGSSRLYYARGRCTHCGAMASITKGWNLRQHAVGKGVQS